MPSNQLERPDPSEIAPHAKAYVDLVPEGDVIEHLNQQIERTVALLQPVADERASTFSYEPGKWTIKEIIGHLSDTERILSCRALRIARGDQTPLPGFEQDGYVRSAHSNDRTLHSLLQEFSIVRQATIALFSSLPGDAWIQRGRVSDCDVTARGLAFTLAGHELHHFKILQERYL